MGDWNTLHLFDGDKFFSRVVALLKGESGNLEEEYFASLPPYPNPSADRMKLIRQTVKDNCDGFKKITAGLDDRFQKHEVYHQLPVRDNDKYIYSLGNYYQFASFFETLVFKYCADFYPHLPLGKSSLYNQFNFKFESLAADIISELSPPDSFFCAEGQGIRGWIGKDEIELLYIDKASLKCENKIFEKNFLNMLEIAYRHKLGLLLGRDMRENDLEKLPGFKLIGMNEWNTLQKTGLIMNIRFAAEK